MSITPATQGRLLSRAAIDRVGQAHPAEPEDSDAILVIVAARLDALYTVLEVAARASMPERQFTGSGSAEISRFAQILSPRAVFRRL